VFYGISALDRNTNMMIGIIILGAMEYIHGIYFPLKSKVKNNLELSLLFNAQILFVTSMYTTSNFIAVNTLVSLALVQCITFALYRLIRHRNLNASFISYAKLSLKCFNFKLSSSTALPQCIELHNKPPEVKHNYTEFQEPLIEQYE